MFESVFGHQRIKHILEKMVGAGQVPHGLCFYGPSGIGKQLMASELAKTMLCEHKTGCGECRHCHKFSTKNHPDYHFIEPDGQDIKVDQIRAIGENLHFRPFESTCRVVVLDRVERLREAAANAFLKSLEEPPEYVFFILVCSDLKALLPTIRSRCQKMAFQSLTRDDKTQILMTKFQKEEAIAVQLARISFVHLETEDGALEVFNQDVKTILSYFQMILKEGHALDAFSDLARDKQAFPNFKNHLMAVVRELIRLSYDAAPDPLFEAFAQPMTAMAKQVESKAWRDCFEQLLWLEGQRRRNLNQGLWFNALSVSSLGLLER